MLIAIVLDKPLAEAKALVDDPAAFTREMTRILIAKQSHPLIAQMMRPTGSGDPPPANSTASGNQQPRTPQRQSARAVPVVSCGQGGVPTVATHDREPLCDRCR